jgi:hypothetical protein
MMGLMENGFGEMPWVNFRVEARNEIVQGLGAHGLLWSQGPERNSFSVFNRELAVGTMALLRKHCP